ncbi:right-handed parallel beta-helix repeat-containing protein [Ruegeria atlantica]|uniref:Uncharacterized protein n=1 Tax=Ruegeria atlantica TaxID=81569 RepID=A0A0P1EFY0_9RHOB|nr:right-handed parallel beta-helix repeat-containing protein [Ruegeria atlantica]CUH49079.1 hypothetical protein RUA4292_03273 [Ruegeria atlantica]
MRWRVILLAASVAVVGAWSAGSGEAADLAATLQADLIQATAGDRINLASGDYGAVQLRGLSFDRTVTLVAQGDVRFDSLVVLETRNLRLEGIRVEAAGGRAAIRIMRSHNIAISHADIGGPSNRMAPMNAVKFGIEIRDYSSNITIENSYVHDVLNGIAHFGTAGFTLSGNRIDHIGADAFKFAGVDRGMIQNNFGPTHFYPAEDTHADFMQFQGPPSKNLEIRGNLLLLQNRFDMQGIFFGGKGTHDNLAIEQNIIFTRMANGIRVSNGQNISVRHNTLINAFAAERPVTRISVPSGSVVQKNIESRKKGKLEGGNIAMQHLDPARKLHYSELFAGISEGQSIQIKDVHPISGGLAETYGAFARLMELHGGG